MSQINARGTTTTAHTKEDSMVNKIVQLSGPDIIPVIPSARASGIYTTTVVNVPAATDSSMVAVPFAAASRRSSPLSLARMQLSRMTMELSTIMPMAIINEVPVIKSTA